MGESGGWISVLAALLHQAAIDANAAAPHRGTPQDRPEAEGDDGAPAPHPGRA